MKFEVGRPEFDNLLYTIIAENKGFHMYIQTTGHSIYVREGSREVEIMPASISSLTFQFSLLAGSYLANNCLDCQKDSLLH